MYAARNTTTAVAVLKNIPLPAILLKTAKELNTYIYCWSLVVKPIFNIYSSNNFLNN
jgi:hypothetical protein